MISDPSTWYKKSESYLVREGPLEEVVTPSTHQVKTTGHDNSISVRKYTQTKPIAIKTNVGGCARGKKCSLHEQPQSSTLKNSEGGFSFVLFKWLVLGFKQVFTLYVQRQTGLWSHFPTSVGGAQGHCLQDAHLPSHLWSRLSVQSQFR